MFLIYWNKNTLLVGSQFCWHVVCLFILLYSPWLATRPCPFKVFATAPFPSLTTLSVSQASGDITTDRTWWIRFHWVTAIEEDKKTHGYRTCCCCYWCSILDVWIVLSIAFKKLNGWNGRLKGREGGVGFSFGLSILTRPHMSIWIMKFWADFSLHGRCLFEWFSLHLLPYLPLFLVLPLQSSQQYRLLAK